MASNTIYYTYYAIISQIGSAYSYFPPASIASTISYLGTPVASIEALTSATWSLTVIPYTNSNAGSATIATRFLSTENITYPPTIQFRPTFEYNFTLTPTQPSSTLSQGSSTTSSGIAGIDVSHSAEVSSTQVIAEFISLTLTTAAASISSTKNPSSAQPSNGSSSPSTPTGEVSSKTSNSSALSTGAKVGIAVGCILGALLVASIVAFICLRRRKRTRNARNLYSDDTRRSKVDGESYKLAATSVTTRSMTLPQPESDQTITRLADRTLDDIELFVENYYVDRHVKSTEISASNMLPFSSPYLGSPLADVVRKSSHPTAVFKHCIAYYLLQKIDPAHNNSMSLLPKHFIMPSKGDRKALSQRRVEIAHSRPDIAEDKDYLLQRDRATEEIIQQIERAFQPWARGNTRERAKNLNGTLAHLSELGQKLFAQPATFEWRWRLPNREQTVMLPGLDKLTDSEAVTLATPIRLVQPRTGVQ